MYENDNFDKTKEVFEKRRKKRQAKKNRVLLIIILILLVTVSLAVYMNIDNPLMYEFLQNFGFSKEGTTIEFKKSENYNLSEFNGDVIVARGDSVLRVNDKMKTEWNVAQNNSTPVVKSRGKYTLSYSFDSDNALLIKDGKAKSLPAGNQVIGGKVNKNGYTALVTREKGYKSQVIVLSPEGEVVYKWHSGDNYIVDVDVSFDNKCLAVATVDFSTDVVSGGLMFFNFSQAKPYAGQILSNNLIMEIKFTGKDSLMVVGDTGSAVYDSDGVKKKEYAYEGKKLTNYDIGTDNKLVLALTEGDSVLTDTQIVLLNKNLKNKGAYVVGGLVKSLDAVKDTTLVATERGLVLLNKRGKELKALDLNKDIKEAVLFGNEKSALIASGITAEIVKLR